MNGRLSVSLHYPRRSLEATAKPKTPTPILMPIFRPSILISDAYGSTKDLTWFHRGGKCFVKDRASSNYVLTPAREEYLDVHRRALAAWREQPHETQLLWNEYGKMAISTGHRMTTRPISLARTSLCRHIMVSTHWGTSTFLRRSLSGHSRCSRWNSPLQKCRQKVRCC